MSGSKRAKGGAKRVESNAKREVTGKGVPVLDHRAPAGKWDREKSLHVSTALERVSTLRSSKLTGSKQINHQF